jgi:hypothetical protein
VSGALPAGRGFVKKGRDIVNWKLPAATTACLISVSAANAMDVATFIAKAEILRDRGMLAMFASEYDEL